MCPPPPRYFYHKRVFEDGNLTVSILGGRGGGIDCLLCACEIQKMFFISQLLPNGKHKYDIWPLFLYMKQIFEV
jgi:hypothetical protein